MKKYIRRIWDGDEERQGGEADLTVMVLNEDELRVIDAALDMYHEAMENAAAFGDQQTQEDAIGDSMIVADIRKDLGLTELDHSSLW